MRLMASSTSRAFGRILSFLYRKGWIPPSALPARPLPSDSGAFEDYLDYFHQNCHVKGLTSWMGKSAMKFPLDAWIYQEIIHEVQPDVIMEIGNLYGGSTLFLANMLDLENKGKVIAIDIDHSHIDFEHKRINWITGDVNSHEVISKVRSLLKPDDKVIIIEDSSHTFDNTLEVLRNYCRFVSVGSYFIVEDGVCKYPFIDGPKPGPYEATHEFLKNHQEFIVDKSKEKFVLTYNPSGYLKKIRL